MSVNQDARRLSFLSQFETIKLTGTEDEMVCALKRRAKELGVEAQTGWILAAGGVFNGEHQVQFNVGTDGWSSRWPEWAYAAARDALLANKKILVIYDGVPFGPNILLVLVMNTSI